MKDFKKNRLMFIKGISRIVEEAVPLTVFRDLPERLKNFNYED